MPGIKRGIGTTCGSMITGLCKTTPRLQNRPKSPCNHLIMIDFALFFDDLAFLNVQSMKLPRVRMVPFSQAIHYGLG